MRMYNNRILFTVLLLSLSFFSVAQVNDSATTSRIQKVLSARYSRISAESRKFIYNAVDLNDDGKPEYLVGLTGSEFCGRAGCNMLVLNSAFKVITAMTIVQYPVYAGAPGGKEVSKGYSNLYLRTGGIGLVKMAWNGHSYPTNPSLAPVVPDSVVTGKYEFLKEGGQQTYGF
jgi:hypothetical protein